VVEEFLVLAKFLSKENSRRQAYNEAIEERPQRRLLPFRLMVNGLIKGRKLDMTYLHYPPTIFAKTLALIH
jgi:hypothetical protein